MLSLMIYAGYEGCDQCTQKLQFFIAMSLPSYPTQIYYQKSILLLKHNELSNGSILLLKHNELPKSILLLIEA